MLRSVIDSTCVTSRGRVTHCVTTNRHSLSKTPTRRNQTFFCITQPISFILSFPVRPRRNSGSMDRACFQTKPPSTVIILLPYWEMYLLSSWYNISNFYWNCRIFSHENTIERNTKIQDRLVGTNSGYTPHPKSTEPDTKVEITRYESPSSPQLIRLCKER